MSDQTPNVICGHCDKPFYLIGNYEGLYYLAWCKECAIECIPVFKELNIEHFTEDDFSSNNLEGCTWSLFSKKTVLPIPKKQSTKNKPMTRACDHCDKELEYPVDGTVSWCKECVLENTQLLKEKGIPYFDEATFNRDNKKSFSWESFAKEVKTIPKKAKLKEPNTDCDHCGQKIWTKNGNTSDSIVWCKDCCLQDAALLKAAGDIIDPHTFDWYIANGWRYWKSTFSDLYQSVSAIPKKTTEIKVEVKPTLELKYPATCDHCGKPIRLFNHPGESYVAWCKECAEEDKDLLEKVGIKVFSKEEMLGYEGMYWRSSSSQQKIKAIAKKQLETKVESVVKTPNFQYAAKCDHCGKEFRSVINTANRIGWCKDCSLTEANLLQDFCVVGFDKATFEREGFEGQTWYICDANAIKLKQIPKKFILNAITNKPCAVTNKPCAVCGVECFYGTSYQNNFYIGLCPNCAPPIYQKVYGNSYDVNMMNQIIKRGDAWPKENIRALKAIVELKAEQSIKTNQEKVMSKKIGCYFCGTPTTNHGSQYANACGSCSQKVRTSHLGYESGYNEPDGYPLYDTMWIPHIKAVKALMAKEKAEKENPFLRMIKKDATNAGYRVAATQMTKGVKSAILMLLKDKGMEGGSIAAIAEMLETEFGVAIVSGILGYGLTYMPGLNEDPRAQKLASSFRIDAMAGAGNKVTEMAFEYLMPVVGEVMQNLPELPQTEESKDGGGAVSIHDSH